MTPEALAALQARAMPGPPRPWSAAEFAELLALPSCHLICAEPTAALLARRAGPEVEVLTIFTAPETRRQGQARHLLDRLQTWALDAGAAEIFLEVAETNAPARALYAAAGFAERGYRKDYYDGAAGHRVHARVMSKSLLS